MKIGFIGLGKMGSQMVQRIMAANHEVVVLDVDRKAVEAMTKKGAKGAEDYKDLLNQLGEKPIVWLMIPSQFVEGEIAHLLNEAPKDSLFIDGGNSDFRDTMHRAEQAAMHDMIFMDVGVSGGVAGLKDGFSMMAGGPVDSYALIEPILDSLGQENGYGHFGPSGAGHFVKMVHNGIEYGMMEAYAEGYQLIKEGPFEKVDLAKLAGVWQHGSIIESNLNRLAEQFLRVDQDLDDIPGEVSESGEARWTLEFARDKKILTPVIQAAFDRRIASQSGYISYATKFLARLRNAFGGHSTTNIESSEGK